MKELTVPELSLILLIGTTSSGKSTFAKKHFKPTEIVSSDACRAIVCDNENDLSVNDDAFDLLHYIVSKRLAAGKLTVVDATNVQQSSRKSFIALAKKYHVLPVAIIVNTTQEVCIQRNKRRTDRTINDHVIKQQGRQLTESLGNLKKEGFRYIYDLDSAELIDSATIIRQKLWTDLKHEHGPFDIIGDIHGCFNELRELLNTLGYSIEEREKFYVSHPAGRKLIFLGDLVDRGPNTPAVLKFVMDCAQAGIAFCVPGNHDMKLHRKLSGKEVQIAHGLDKSLEQLKQEPPAFINKAIAFLDGLISHYVLDEGKLVVAHAGMKEEYIGRSSGEIRDFALFGETTGETDEYGLPVRAQWANTYRGNAMVVYGHTPIPVSEWVNHTINIDNGCVYGGHLTALRYPEKELVSVTAKETYAEPIKPLFSANIQKIRDDVLDIDDVIGKRIVTTRLRNTVTVQEENAIAALEVMSRFAINPKWLIYLPPTMSPTETSEDPTLLEHPLEALKYYHNQNISKVVCQEKHMGSRAIVIVCKDHSVSKKRFGVEKEKIGACYTRTGRSFFDDAALESQFLEKVRRALDKAGLWDKLNTDWICLDCELMPWSAKAQDLIKEQYAAVGAAGREGISLALDLLNKKTDFCSELSHLQKNYVEKAEMIAKYTQAYQRYCWPVFSIDDYKLAPFSILATEGAVHMGKDQDWHLEMIHQLCDADKTLFKKTQFKVVNTEDPSSWQEVIEWWGRLTNDGGEGMVVKPYIPVSIGKQGLVQPGIKCRGREYLRIIYGAEYTTEKNIARLKKRYLAHKRSLALREFALGNEALERFVNKDPLYRYHEPVFAILALESEPIDPRL